MAKSDRRTYLGVNMSTNTSKRELLRQKRKKEKQRKFFIVAIILIAAIALFATAIMLPRLLMNRAKFTNAEGFTIGVQDAPVTVVQFSSYSCGFCKDFAERQEPDFIANFVDTGKVYFRYVNIPSNDPASQLAAQASYCAADQDGFFEYRGFLYDGYASPDGYSASNLINYANRVGLETEQFQTCLDGEEFERAFMDDIQFAQSIGVTYTPSFLVNDQLVNANELVSTVEDFLNQ
jgi:protein-disulfide isomerase